MRLNYKQSIIVRSLILCMNITILASSTAIGGYQLFIFFIKKKYSVINIIVIIIKIILALFESNLYSEI